MSAKPDKPSPDLNKSGVRPKQPAGRATTEYWVQSEDRQLVPLGEGYTTLRRDAQGQLSGTAGMGGSTGLTFKLEADVLVHHHSAPPARVNGRLNHGRPLRHGDLVRWDGTLLRVVKRGDMTARSWRPPPGSTPPQSR